MTALATSSDVENQLGRSLSSTEAELVDAKIDAASTYIRTVTRRRFEAGTVTVTRKTAAGPIHLDAPASVTSVTRVDDAGNAFLVTADRYRLRGSKLYGLRPFSWFEIVYEAAGAAPQEIVDLAAGIAATAITDPNSSVASATRGPFAETYRDGTGGIRVTDAQQRVLDKYAAWGRFGAVSLL